MSLLQLSKRSSDLLAEPQVMDAPLKPPHDSLAEVKNLEAPQRASTDVPHELVAEGSRMNPSISSVVNARRMLGGSGMAEQMIIELNSAAHINRGPDSVFESSRLHWDMILGRDSEIHPSDYLNFDAHMKY